MRQPPPLFLHSVVLTDNGPITQSGLKVVRDSDGPKGMVPGAAIPIFPATVPDGYYRRVRLNRVEGVLRFEIVPPEETAEHDIHAIGLSEDGKWGPAAGVLSPVIDGCETVLISKTPISVDFRVDRGSVRVEFDPATGMVTSNGKPVPSVPDEPGLEWKDSPE